MKNKINKEAAGDQETNPANQQNIEEKLAQAKNKTDTAPDEFISPSADTDQPMDGHVVNDAVLFGEDHATMNIDKLGEKGNKPGKQNPIDKGNL